MQLWNAEYPTTLAYKNILAFANYLDNLKELRHLLIFEKSDNIVGWVFSFDRDNERCFAIILSEAVHGKGLGKLSLEKLKAAERELNGWVIDSNSYKKSNGQSYPSPIEFYRKAGFSVLTKKRLELEQLSAVKVNWTR
jgi:GNAT superfamily N-acetyltransferase